MRGIRHTLQNNVDASGGWIQQDATPYRTRCSKNSNYKLQSNTSKKLDVMLSPLTILMSTSTLNFCGVIDNYNPPSNTLMCLGRNAELLNRYELPYKFEETLHGPFIDFVMDNNFNYYLTARNATSAFIIKVNSFKNYSQIMEGSTAEFHFTGFNGMVITENGLIGTIGNELINIDMEIGKRNWAINVTTNPRNGFLLYDNTLKLPVLFLIRDEGIYKIDTKNGKILDYGNINLNILPYFPTVLLGNNFILVREEEYFTVFDKYNLGKGQKFKLYLNGNQIFPYQCSGGISNNSTTNSFYIHCTLIFKSEYIFRVDFSPSSNKLEIVFAIDISKIFNIDPQTVNCATEIVEYGKRGNFALVCKEGIVSFDKDGKTQFRNMKFKNIIFTKAFGTLDSIAVFSQADHITTIDFVNME